MVLLPLENGPIPGGLMTGLDFKVIFYQISVSKNVDVPQNQMGILIQILLSFYTQTF